MNHKIVRVNDLMYKGCEPHWHCTNCKDYWPFHCYTKEQLESKECKTKTSYSKSSPVTGTEIF